MRDSRRASCEERGMTLWGGCPRQPLAGLGLGAVLGIFLAEGLHSVAWPLWLSLLLIVAGWSLLRLSSWRCWLLTVAAFALLHHLQQFGNEARQLSAHFEESRQVRGVGVVISEPREPQQWSRTMTCSFQLQLEELEIDGRRSASSATVHVRWAGEVPAYGDRVRFRGAARNLAPMRNPGQFDWVKYQQRLRIYTEVVTRFPQDCRILEHDRGNPVQHLAQKARENVQAILSKGLEEEPEVTNLISSMVLGMRGETPDEVRELFQHTGTLHLFAVSGLNVAMLAYLSAMLLKSLRIRRDILAALIIPIIAGYAILTGLGASSIRAAIMGGILLAAVLCDRPAVLYNSLGAAALGILAWDSNQLFTPGFQFSFVLVITLVLLSTRLQRRLEPWGEPDAFLPRALRNWRQRCQVWLWRNFAATAAVTITAWLGSLLFTAAYFHLFSPTAILANFAAVPLAFCILGLGLLATLCGGVTPTVATLFNNANWACSKGLLWVIQFCAAIPGGYSYVQFEPLAPTPVCQVTVLDLGEGAANHLRTAAGDWLIDCGHAQPFRRTVLPFLRSRGVNRLEGIVLTHGDAQHMGGAIDVLEELRPAIWWDNALKDRSQTRRKLHQELTERRIGKRFLRRGEVASLGPDCQLEVLFPPAGYARSLADDKALVLRLHVGRIRLLFMSDSGFATESWLLEHEPDLRADVLIKGWHSRDLSGGIDFIARVAPRVVIAGTPNFGTPPERTEQWAAALRARGIPLLRQEEVGGVMLDLSPAEVRLRPYVTGAELVLPAR